MSIVKIILIDPEPSYNLEETLRSQPQPSSFAHLFGHESYRIDLHLLHLFTNPELLCMVVITPSNLFVELVSLLIQFLAPKQILYSLQYF